MPISISPYLVAGTSFDYTPGRSGGFKQRFLVNGFDPVDDAACALACYATDASTGFTIPAYSAAHSTIPNFFVDSFHGEPIAHNSRTAVLVELTYRPPEMIPGATTIEIIGSSGTKTISRWPNGGQVGQPMVIGYNPSGGVFPDQIPPDPAGMRAGKKLGINYSHAIVNVLSPNTILRFTRRETSSPLNKSKQYRRTVNSQAWQGGATGTWLCRRIDGRNMTQSANLVAPGLYNVTYEFEYDPQGWSYYAIFKDALTHASPQDIVIDGNFNGFTIVTPYDRLDFNALLLPIAT